MYNIIVVILHPAKSLEPGGFGSEFALEEGRKSKAAFT
jgi:hypothetical protein